MEEGRLVGARCRAPGRGGRRPGRRGLAGRPLRPEGAGADESDVRGDTRAARARPLPRRGASRVRLLPLRAGLVGPGRAAASRSARRRGSCGRRRGCPGSPPRTSRRTRRRASGGRATTRSPARSARASDADGRALFALMPYGEFRRIPDEDVAAIVVYLRSLPPVRNPLPQTALPFPVSVIMKGVPAAARGTRAGAGPFDSREARRVRASNVRLPPLPHPDEEGAARRGARHGRRKRVRVAAGRGLLHESHTRPDRDRPLRRGHFRAGDAHGQARDAPPDDAVGVYRG